MVKEKLMYFFIALANISTQLKKIYHGPIYGLITTSEKSKLPFKWKYKKSTAG